MYLYEMQPDEEQQRMMQRQPGMEEQQRMMQRQPGMEEGQRMMQRQPGMEEQQRMMQRQPGMEEGQRMMQRQPGMEEGQRMMQRQPGMEERQRMMQQPGMEEREMRRRLPGFDERDFGRRPEPDDDFIDMAGQEAAFARDARLINDIQQAIIGEAHAYDYYERLAQLAPNAYARRIIMSIQQDEARHRRWFTMILRMLGARAPFIPPGELPRRYREGLRNAIRDELEAAATYQNIAFRATARPIENRFMHASRDEHRHASWLQVLMNI
ncbi:MAG: hypothetical protein ACYCX2_11960 [Christensenellales bacterium]